jgi:hypothetical protein
MVRGVQRDLNPYIWCTRPTLYLMSFACMHHRGGRPSQGERNRTSNVVLPKHALYQVEVHPEIEGTRVEGSVCCFDSSLYCCVYHFATPSWSGRGPSEGGRSRTCNWACALACVILRGGCLRGRGENRTRRKHAYQACACTTRLRVRLRTVAGRVRIELTASGFGIPIATLAFRPVVEPRGVEPLTYALPARRSPN